MDKRGAVRTLLFMERSAANMESEARKIRRACVELRGYLTRANIEGEP